MGEPMQISKAKKKIVLLAGLSLVLAAALHAAFPAAKQIDANTHNYNFLSHEYATGRDNTVRAQENAFRSQQTCLGPQDINCGP